jgi:hypothetical protein
MDTRVLGAAAKRYNNVLTVEKWRSEKLGKVRVEECRRGRKKELKNRLKVLKGGRVEEWKSGGRQWKNG